MSRNQRPRPKVTLWLAVWLVLGGTAFAHPFHTTTAEMEFNQKTGRYEVALKILTADLEKALARHAATIEKDGATQRVDLDKTPHVERLIVGYLKSNFFLSSILPQQDAGNNNETRLESQSVAAPKPAVSSMKETLVWVGKERDQASTWLYFELVAPENGSLTLTNRLLFDLNSGQINSCIIRTPSGRTSLKSDARQPTAALPSIRR